MQFAHKRRSLVMIQTWVVGLCAVLATLTVEGVAQRVCAQDAQSSERALELLLAAEKARVAIPPGLLELSTLYAHPDEEPRENLLRVSFDGTKRLFEQVVDQGGTRLIFNGEAVLYYDGDRSATIGEPNSTSEYCFDPRTLGISVFFRIEDTVKDCFAYEDARSISLFGSEEINGHVAAKVRVIDRFEQQRDFWIEDAEGHRVLKVELSRNGSLRHQVLSTYDDASAQPALPQKVSDKHFRSDGSLHSERVLEIKSATWDQKFKDSTWTLYGLRMSGGTAVVDLRLKRRIGYWSGIGLSLEP